MARLLVFPFQRCTVFQSFYQGNPFLDLPILSMFLFVGTFVAAVLMVWIKGKDDPTLDALSRLPLEDGESAQRN